MRNATEIFRLHNPIAAALAASICVLVLASGPIGQVSAQEGVRARDKIVAHTRIRTRKSGRKILRQAAATVSLLIVANPPDGKVFVDGELRAEPDANGELEVILQPGSHPIRVSRDGYVAREADVEITPAPYEQQVEFTLSPLLVSLNVLTDPPSTEVYLDEVYKGSTNASGLLVIERVNPTQTHSLRVYKDGFVKQPAAPITTYSGQISFKLSRDSMTLKVITDPPEAEVYLDDAYKGTSTLEGLLLIEGVNPNQSHRLRAGKREGFLQRTIVLQANQAEAEIKLPPDPVVLLVKSIKQQLAEGRLPEAFAGYNQLALDVPDYAELPRLLENLLQKLQVRSVDLLKQVGFFGLSLEPKDAREMKQLYEYAQKWKSGDEAISTFAKYWDLKNSLTIANQTTSLVEAESSQRRARVVLQEFAEHNLSNPYLLFELGWAWWKLNDRDNAVSYFDTAQKVKPEWAYPHFARGFLAMNGADAERNKSEMRARYGQAIDYFNKAISLKHDFARAYAQRGLAYIALKQPDEAIGNGLQAVALDPQSSYAHFALGFAYLQKGKSKYGNARNELNQALALNGLELEEPTKSLIRQQLEQIKRALK
jgi:Flp pilus assembly protein TadD